MSVRWLDVDVDDWDAVGDVPPGRRAVDPRDVGDGLTALVEDLGDWR